MEVAHCHHDFVAKLLL